jgi:uncharacterized protein YbcI
VTGPPEPLVGGALNQAIANAVVRSHTRLVGRGPTKAQAFYRHNVVVVLMQDTLTVGERTLVANGRVDAVHALRLELQPAMQAELTDEVERLTGCVVEAFMSTNHIDPDLAAQLFVLDRSIATA